jgi:hypothetical protein
MEAVGVMEARSPWLFSRSIDLSVFLGSALLAFALLGVGAMAGVLDDATPDWAWVPCVLLVDVAHVYSTSFRIYLDGEELSRRPVLYALVPAVGLAVAALLYGLGPMVFWRSLAYLAVFHFVRQQYGWVALYRSRCGEYDRLGHWLDAATIYAATLYPLAYWHAHLPRRFWWFLEGDFLVDVPTVAVDALAPVYWGLLALYAVRSARAWLAGRPNPGKDVVVATTALCWYVGIVAFNSDYAFTVTNVIIHGVPYLALVYFARRRRAAVRPDLAVGRVFAAGAAPFLVALWGLAFVEELAWDRAIWHDRAWLFGHGWDVGWLEYAVVPVLALPQIVHYVLDGFIWKRRERADP